MSDPHADLLRAARLTCSDAQTRLTACTDPVCEGAMAANRKGARVSRLLPVHPLTIGGKNLHAVRYLVA